MAGLIAELDELINLRRYAHLAHLRSQKNSSQEPGNHYSRLLGRGMDFAEIRNYQAGDEIRHMEWRVTARTGRPYIKLYQEERERPVMLFCDFSPSMYFGTRVAFKSVIAARLAALLAWVTVKQEDRIGGVIYSAKNYHEIIPQRRHNAILPLLSALSQETQQIQIKKQNQMSSTILVSLDVALERLKRIVRAGTLIVIISDFYFLNKDNEHHFHRLATRNPIIAYPIFDPIELVPLPPGNYPVATGKQQFLFDMTQANTQAKYQAYCNERLAYLDKIFKQLQIRATQVTTQSDLPTIVRKTFCWRQRG